MTVADRPLTEEEVYDRCANDFPWYAGHFLQIVGPDSQPVSFRLRPGQRKLWEALKAQKDAGQPMRARIHKARRIGFSTMAQGLALQRTTQRPNHHAYTVTHDRETGGELFAMADWMYNHLPDDLLVKPPVAGRRRKQELYFGEKAAVTRMSGRMGLNSWMRVDTANELEAGRGLGIHTLHCSEVAFWRDAKTKLRGLMQAVPYHPDTLVLQESTANGYNYWRELWYQDDDFAKVFVAWFEEPSYRQLFANDGDRAEFISSIGTSDLYGAYEEGLVEQFGLAENGRTGPDDARLEPEQLKWWRWALINNSGGDLRSMQQENPSTPEEAFLSTGQKVFDPIRVQKMIREVQQDHEQNPPAEGIFKPGGKTTRKTYNGTIEVPTSAVWVPKADTNLSHGEPVWLVWEPPVDGDQYIIGADVASEEENEAGDSAWHCIQVVNHRTENQAAEFRVRGYDSDELANEILLAALHWNRPWVAIEITGGWGAPANRKLYRDFKYPFIYKRKSLERTREHHEDLLGWDSNKVTKRFLIEDTREDLRDWNHGVRSVGLAQEHATLVKDRKGMAAPEYNAFSDRFMAFRIAKRVAQEKPVRPDRKPGHVTSTATRAIRSGKMGY